MSHIIEGPLKSIGRVRSFSYDDESKKYTVTVARPEITKVAFVGGGSKGLVYPGAVKALDERHLLKKIDTVAGSSAGALTAVLVAIGLSPEEIEKEITQLSLKDLLKFNEPSQADESRGMFSGKILLDKLRALIEKTITAKIEKAQRILQQKLNEVEKNDTKNIEYFLQMQQQIKNINPLCVCFKDLSILRKILGNEIKDLILTGSNIDDEKLEYFETEHHPDMEIALAARISASFPGVFKAVEYKGKRYVDGGVINNFPIQSLETFYADQSQPVFPERRNEEVRLSLLGFMFEDEDNTKYVKHKQNPYELGPITSIKKYLTNKVSGVATSSYRADLRKTLAGEYSNNIIFLPIGDVTTLTQNVALEKKRKLQEDARQTTNQSLSEILDSPVEFVFEDPIEMLLTMNINDFNDPCLIEYICSIKENHLLEVYHAVRKVRENETKMLSNIFECIESTNSQLSLYLKNKDGLVGNDFALEIKDQLENFYMLFQNFVRGLDDVNLIDSKNIGKYRDLMLKKILSDTNIGFQLAIFINSIEEFKSSTQGADDLGSDILQRINQLIDDVTKKHVQSSFEIEKQKLVAKLSLKKGLPFQNQENLVVINRVISEIQSAPDEQALQQALSKLDEYGPRNPLAYLEQSMFGKNRLFSKPDTHTLGKREQPSLHSTKDKRLKELREQATPEKSPFDAMRDSVREDDAKALELKELGNNLSTQSDEEEGDGDKFQL